MIMILKPGKKSQETSFISRPLALLPVISKISEKLLVNI